MLALSSLHNLVVFSIIVTHMSAEDKKRHREVSGSDGNQLDGQKLPKSTRKTVPGASGSRTTWPPRMPRGERGANFGRQPVRQGDLPDMFENLTDKVGADPIKGKVSPQKSDKLRLDE